MGGVAKRQPPRAVGGGGGWLGGVGAIASRVERLALGTWGGGGSD